MADEIQQLTCGRCEADVTREELMQFQGVCEVCCDELQANLDEFNERIDHWERLSDAEREAAIRMEL